MIPVQIAMRGITLKPTRRNMGGSAFDKLFKTCVPHILEQIFFSLDYDSYKACHLVCKDWNEMLSTESFKQKANKILTENNVMLRSATRKGNVDEVRRILSKSMVDVNCDWESFPGTLLCFAINEGHFKMVKILLDARADPNKVIKYGDTPLHVAACAGRKAILKLLLDRGAEPNTGDKCGSTPLHVAVNLLNVDVVKFLTKRGVDVDKPDDIGCSPLHTATQMCGGVGRKSPKQRMIKKMIQVLLEAGADPNKEDQSGQTPLSVARTGDQRKYGHIRDILS